ncbi:MAG: small multi-drug export protein [Armatimonadota bacterium]
MAATVVKIITVIIMGTGELWAAIPAGFILKLDPVAICISSISGAVAGMFIVLFIGEKIRAWLLKGHNKKKDESKKSAIYRIWDKYGITGFGLLAPLITGASIGMAIGIALGIDPKRLIRWMLIGIVMWSIILTIVCSLGLMGIKTIQS